LTVIVDLKKCNGCRHLEEPQCEKLCPGDLMVLNPETKKAFINVEKDCWDCMVCVKACPMRAIETKLPFSIVYYGASLKPTVKKDSIIWSLKDSDGNEEIFEIKTRF
jgi:adenylylsulfate reductase subunit B